MFLCHRGNNCKWNYYFKNFFVYNLFIVFTITLLLKLPQQMHAKKLNVQRYAIHFHNKTSNNASNLFFY